MSLDDDRNWAAKIYQERAETIDADRNVTCFLLQDYEEICRYMRTIGYGSKGKAESVEKHVTRELEIGRYCSLRTTVRGRRSTQDIALFVYHDVAANLSGCGLVVVNPQSHSLTLGSKRLFSVLGRPFPIGGGGLII